MIFCLLICQYGANLFLAKNFVKVRIRSLLYISNNVFLLPSIQGNPVTLQDIYYEVNLSSAGIFEQSIGAKNRVGIGLPYRPARAQICKRLRSPGIDSKESIPGMAFLNC